MAVNDVSGSLGYHGLGGAFALAGVVTAAVWIRGLDPDAPLPRYATWLFLTPAGVAAAIAAFSSELTGSTLTIVAVVLTLGAVLVAKELESAARVLGGAAFIAVGAAVIAGGAASTADREVLFGPAFIAGGAVLIAGGTAFIADREVLIGPAVLAGGTAFIAAGAAFIADREVLIGVAFIAGGAAVIALAAALIAHRGVLYGAAVIAGGATVIVLGMAAVAERDVLYGAAIIAAGAALIPLGAAFITGRKVLIGVAFVAVGAAVIALGAASIAGREVLIGAAFIAIGAAGIVYGATYIGPSTIVIRARQVVDWATKPARTVDEQKAEFRAEDEELHTRIAASGLDERRCTAGERERKPSNRALRRASTGRVSITSRSGSRTAKPSSRQAVKPTCDKFLYGFKGAPSARRPPRGGSCSRRVARSSGNASRGTPKPQGTPVVPGTALRWGSAEAARSRLGLRVPRAPPRRRARYCLPWRRPATTRSCTSGQPADGGGHQGDRHPGEPSRRGLRPRAPVRMDCRPRCFNPSLPTRHAAESSLHQRGEDPAPGVRARLRRGLRLKDGPGHPEPQAAVWLR